MEVLHLGDPELETESAGYLQVSSLAAIVGQDTTRAEVFAELHDNVDLALIHGDRHIIHHILQR